MARCSRKGYECILIGHQGHPEVEGTLGQYDHPTGRAHLVETVADVAHLQLSDPEHAHYVTQTTLSVRDTAAVIDALKARFPSITGPRKDDICYATQNRQAAVLTLTERCQLVLVVGSETSSNSNRLRELAEQQGCDAYLIDSAAELDPGWFAGVTTVGLTAGASAPERLVQDVVARLRAIGAVSVEENVQSTRRNCFFFAQIVTRYARFRRLITPWVCKTP